MEPIQIEERTRFVWFETEDGVFAFRYSSLRFFRWETHGEATNEQAIHFQFDHANVSVVGSGLRKLLAGIQRQTVAGIRVGETQDPAPVQVTYVSVKLRDEPKKHEGVNRGLA